MNLVALIGRNTKDVEVRVANNGTSILTTTLAVDRRFKQEGGPTADFIRCQAFGKTAEFIEKYLGKKGQKMAINGRIQTGSYKNKDGQTVYTTDVVIENVEFVEGKSSDSGESKADSDGFMSVPEGVDEELPFR